MFFADKVEKANTATLTLPSYTVYHLFFAFYVRTGVPKTCAGIGRILYSLLEHSFSIRKAEDDADDGGMRRGVMSFRPLVAPIKCAVLPLSSQASFLPLCARAMDDLGHLHLRYTSSDLISDFREPSPRPPRCKYFGWRL